MSKVIQVSFKDTTDELKLYELLKSKSSPGATIKDILKEYYKISIESCATNEHRNESRNEIDDLIDGLTF